MKMKDEGPSAPKLSRRPSSLYSRDRYSSRINFLITFISEATINYFCPHGVCLDLTFLLFLFVIKKLHFNPFRSKSQCCIDVNTPNV